MKNKEFRAFIAQLGALTIVQRKALLRALSFKGSSDVVVGLHH